MEDAGDLIDKVAKAQKLWIRRAFPGGNRLNRSGHADTFRVIRTKLCAVTDQAGYACAAKLDSPSESFINRSTLSKIGKRSSTLPTLGLSPPDLGLLLSEEGASKYLDCSSIS